MNIQFIEAYGRTGSTLRDARACIDVGPNSFGRWEEWLALALWPNKFGPTGGGGSHRCRAEFIRPTAGMVGFGLWPNRFGPTGRGGPHRDVGPNSFGRWREWLALALWPNKFGPTGREDTHRDVGPNSFGRWWDGCRWPVAEQVRPYGTRRPASRCRAEFIRPTAGMVGFGLWPNRFGPTGRGGPHRDVGPNSSGQRREWLALALWPNKFGPTGREDTHRDVGPNSFGRWRRWLALALWPNKFGPTGRGGPHPDVGPNSFGQRPRTEVARAHTRQSPRNAAGCRRSRTGARCRASGGSVGHRHRR